MYWLGYDIDEIYNGFSELWLVLYLGVFDFFDILVLKMCN